MSNKNVIKKSALSPTALIVGGAGFIGSHLAQSLLEKDIRVVVVDNFRSGKEVYIHKLLKNDNFALFDADINYGIPKQIDSVDYIIHLAALEHYLYDKSDINLDSLLTNSIGTKNVLDFCKRSAAKMVLASSIDVYKGLMSPIDLATYFGKTDIDEKEYSLNEAKRYSEALVWEYYKRNHIDIRIARFPEVYGPRMNLLSSGSLGKHLDDLINNRNLTIEGEGSKAEYYVYVDDAVRGLIKSLLSEETAGKIYTLSGTEPRTSLQVAYLLKSLASSELTIEFTNEPHEQMLDDKIVPDVSSALDLGWVEKTEFKKGVEKTLEWFGYETNSNSFKPAKLLEEKQKKPQTPVPSFSMPKEQSLMSIAAEKPAFVAKDVKKPSLKEFFSFKKKLKNLNLPSIKLPSFNFKSNFSLLSKFNFAKKITKSPDLLKVPTEKASVTLSKKKLTVIGFTFLTIVLLVTLVFPFSMFAFKANSGLKNIEQAKNSLENFDSQSAEVYSQKGFDDFISSQKWLTRLKPYAVITGQTPRYNDLTRILRAASYSSRSAYFVAKGTAPFSDFWNYMNPNSTEEFSPEMLGPAKSNLNSASSSIQLAIAELNLVTYSFNGFDYNQTRNQLVEADQHLSIGLTLLDSLPDILGTDEEKTYLLLFQNNNEIRPTGGFIGSYATLKVANGKISELVIDDVYNPDGQIDLREINVEPSDPIKVYLEEERLHIRNANWDPDFPNSSDTIKDLFYKLDGRQYDGVIAIDLYFVKNLLEVTGPVYLAAYNEEITPNNLYEKTQFHSEFNYENGSDQKRSFLTILGGKLLERLFSLDTSDVNDLALMVKKSLDEKHLLIHVPNSSINKFLVDSNWNGRVMNTESDYLYVVNSNVGGTKANYYVDEEMDYQVFSRTRDGLLRAELTLNYEHTGLDSSWPSGPYTNYVRVLTPVGTKLTGSTISLSGQEATAVFEEVITTETGTYNTFELGFVLEPQQNVELKFEYDLSERHKITPENTKYSLFWQKQPGTHDDQISFKFNAPFSMSVQSALPNSVKGANTLEYKGLLNKDLNFDINLN